MWIMNKDVIVRKPGGQRGAVRFFGVVFIFGPLIFLFFSSSLHPWLSDDSNLQFIIQKS